MTKWNSALIVSVGLNIWLVGARIRLPITQLNTTEAAIPKSGLTMVPRRAGPGPAILRDTQEFRWDQLESADYRIYIANLRIIGCPEETVQDIILAEINKLYAPRLAAARRATARRHYWQATPGWSPETYALQRALYKERNALVKQLLGIDPEDPNRKNDPTGQAQDDAFGFLPESKRQSLRELDQEYSELERRIYADAHGLITLTDRASLDALKQQRSSAMDALLTPEERLEYQLRESPTAHRLQQELEAFQPSEAEFRGICQAQIASDEKSATSPSADSSGRSPESSEQLQNEIKAVLGDQRYSDYQRSQDPGYQTLLRITARYGLPPEVAGQVFDLKQNVELQGSQALNSVDLTDDQKQNWLQTLRAQTGSAVANLLGEKGFSVYHDYGGSWIDRLGK